MRGNGLHIVVLLAGMLDVWEEKHNTELIHLVWMKVRNALIDSKVWAKVKANRSCGDSFEQGKVTVRLLLSALELAVMAEIER